MKKKSTRFTILIVGLILTCLLVLGAILFFAFKSGLISPGISHETVAVSQTQNDPADPPMSENAASNLTSQVVEDPMTDPEQSDSSSYSAETNDTSEETEEDTTTETENQLPHDRVGVWAAFSHAKEKKDLDASMALFSDMSVSGKNPLRLFGGEYNRLVFFNDSEEDLRIYFAPDVPAETEEHVFTLKAGEEKELWFSVKENLTSSYALCYAGSSFGVCYIQSDTQLEQILNEFSIPVGTVVHLEGASSNYDVRKLYRIPACEILWKGTGVTGAFIALNTNATKWNGETISGNYPVGGASGVELNSVSILPSKNAFTSVELKYEQTGNAFKVNIPVYIDQATTTKASLTISANGNIELSGDGLNADGTIDLFKPVICKVTNAKGESHSYQLSAAYESYNVPTVYIKTNNGKMVSSKNSFISGTFSMDADNVPGIASIPETTMQIQGRGHSTWKKDKKPFNIKFDEKISILGLPSNRDWVMLANYFDPTMSRNYISFELARKLNFDFVPTSYPVQVIYNGKYIGMYCIGDKVEVASGRVNQVKESADVDRDYLIEVRGYESGYRMGHSAFQAGLLRDIAIKNPKPEAITKEQFAYISDYVKKANDAVVNLTDYEQYIDVDSLIDWFIITELTYNCDGAFNRSVYIQKRAGQKLTFSPVWDFDLALGNVGNLTPDYDSWACSQNGFGDTEITWGTYLIQDPKFRDRLQKRWEQVRVILRNTATESLKTMRHLMEKAGDSNFAMWVIPGEKLGWEWEFVAQYTDYKMHMDYIEVFLDKRFKVLDRVFIERIPMRYYADGKLHGEPVLSPNASPVYETVAPPPTTEEISTEESEEDISAEETEPSEDTSSEETEPSGEASSEDTGPIIDTTVSAETEEDTLAEPPKPSSEEIKPEEPGES